MAFFDDLDLNGDAYIAGETGEAEALEAYRIIHFGDDAPAAAVPGTATAFTATQVAQFVHDNFLALKKADISLSDEICARISFVRYLVARAGLASPAFGTAANHVRYNEAVRGNVTSTPATEAFDFPEDMAEDEVPVFIGNHLALEIRTKLRKEFTNAVCAIAYLFRVRGHHWMDDMNDKYAKLWRKCLRNEDFPVIEWKYWAHHATHAIMPRILDNFWRNTVEAGQCAGALSKRFDSAPAGTAAFRALYVGMQDLASAVPGYKQQNISLYDEMDRILRQVTANRWAGSINRSFYGAPTVAFNEGKFAGIASTLLAALDQLAPSSTLRGSVALRRIASGAPISGGFIARMIATAAADPSNAKALLLKDSEDDDE